MAILQASGHLGRPCDAGAGSAPRLLLWSPAVGVPQREASLVIRSDRPRTVLGVPVSLAVLAVLAGGTGVAGLVGVAVMQWLERSA